MGICSYKNNIIIPINKELNQSPPDIIIIPKYNELNQSPTLCFNKHCIKTQRARSSPDNINKHCINKHTARSINKHYDECYYNKYMKT